MRNVDNKLYLVAHFEQDTQKNLEKFYISIHVNDSIQFVTSDFKVLKSRESIYNQHKLNYLESWFDVLYLSYYLHEQTSNSRKINEDL